MTEKRGITPESTPEEIKEILKDVKDIQEVRELTRDATVQQRLEVILPYLYEKSQEAQDRLKGTTGSFQFCLEGEEGGHWAICLTDGDLEVKTGKIVNPSVTITVNVSDWLSIARGEMDPQAAFMGGKLRIAGDMALAMKLGALLRPPQA
jgi:putative sterol carrier protein